MRIWSWNVNGLRAAHKKGFLDWLAECGGDIVGIQEIKALEEQLPDEVRTPSGYHGFFHPAQRKGYSGVALFTRDEPDEVLVGFGDERFDVEGRVIGVRFGNLIALSCYFPNGGQGPERVAYKLDFYAAFLEWMNAQREAGRILVVSGDYNTAHHEIDLARPKENQETSGFLPEEREWVDRYVDAGWVDTFRHFHPDTPDRYSWWTYRAGARAKNVGWRIDYHMVDEDNLSRVTASDIHDDVMGSDHAPIRLEIDY